MNIKKIMAINSRVEFCELLMSRLHLDILITEVFSRLKLSKRTEEWEGPREGREGKGKRREKEGRKNKRKDGSEGSQPVLLGSILPRHLREGSFLTFFFFSKQGFSV